MQEVDKGTFEIQGLAGPVLTTQHLQFRGANNHCLEATSTNSAICFMRWPCQLDGPKGQALFAANQSNSLAIKASFDDVAKAPAELRIAGLSPAISAFIAWKLAP